MTHFAIMAVIFAWVGIYAYYRVKRAKKESQMKSEESNHHLNKIFNNDENRLYTSKNVAKITLLCVISLVGLVDTGFDL